MSAAHKTAEITNALFGEYLGCITASEVQLDKGKRRADFLAMHPVASQNYRVTIFEIKVTRADFRNDGLEKQGAALSMADRFYYVTPEGLLKKEEVPEWAGLIEYGHEKNGRKRFITIKRSPIYQKSPPSWDFIVSLLRASSDVRRDEFAQQQVLLKHWQSRVADMEAAMRLSQERLWEAISQDRLKMQTAE